LTERDSVCSPEAASWDSRAHRHRRDRLRPTRADPDPSSTVQGGTYRWFSDHRLPTEHGGATITVRLHGNREDAKHKFNRTENLRPIPPDDPGFDRLYGRRNDAESINRHLDDTLWLGRAHSIGRHRQGLNLLTYALCVNGLALYLHRLRQPVAA
jgi:hypothetical protein